MSLRGALPGALALAAP